MKLTTFPPFLFFITFSLTIFSQSNIQQSLSVNNTGAAADASAQLDVDATDKGMLVPRMTSAQRSAIASPAAGLLVFDTSTGSFWFYGGTAWVNLSTPKTLADADNDTKVQVEKNPDEDIIRFDLGGAENMVLRKTAATSPRLELPNALGNTFIGTNAGFSTTTGASNTGIGRDALPDNTTGTGNSALGVSALNSNTTGIENSAIGLAALATNTTGNFNTALGSWALYNTTSSNNTGIGHRTMFANTIGNNNTATGFETLRFNTTGSNNVANGYHALNANTIGFNNTANGFEALKSNTSGTVNTATGSKALQANTSGSGNTANGSNALFANTTGTENTAVGGACLFFNTTGISNTATGAHSMENNSSGNYNTANGAYTLFSNSTGSKNTAVGYYALLTNTSGFSNVAVGTGALQSNTTRSNLVAVGDSSLFKNSTGSFNTALGSKVLYNNTSGTGNTAGGSEALIANTAGSGNTVFGRLSLMENTTGSNNTIVGWTAADEGTTNSQCVAIGAASDVGGAISYTNAIAIGYNANTSANNYARIGNTSVTSIGGQVGWSTYSDGRFKKSVRQDVAGLDFITRLRPVTYQWDIRSLDAFIPNSKDDSIAWASKYDIEKIRFAGFIAQEVEQAAQMAGFDFSGVDKPQNEFTPYALRYGEFVVPLVKGMQELAELTGQQQEELEALRNENATLKSQLNKITVALADAGIAVEQ